MIILVVVVVVVVIVDGSIMVRISLWNLHLFSNFIYDVITRQIPQPASFENTVEVSHVRPPPQFEFEFEFDTM